MATASRSQTISASPQQVWDVLEDPHHIPRWWPGVVRVEGVEGERWTQVHQTKRGRPVRMDFRVVVNEPPWQRAWEQEIAGSPFERVLIESVTEVVLEPEGSGTKVTIAQRQKLRGYSKTGGLMFRRATAKKLEEALDGLRLVFG